MLALFLTIYAGTETEFALPACPMMQQKVLEVLKSLKGVSDVSEPKDNKVTITHEEGQTYTLSEVLEVINKLSTPPPMMKGGMGYGRKGMMMDSSQDK